VAHNLVVVDGANQTADPSTYGSLRYFDATHAGCQVLSVDNPQVYPGVTQVYRRTVALVDLDSAGSYLVDIFQVQGGLQHDYFLHGSADQAQQLHARIPAGPLTLEPMGTLVPTGTTFVAGQNEQTSHCTEPGVAYGYLNDLSRARLDRPTVVQLDYGPAEAGDGAEAGLRAWCVTRAGDDLVLGTNPAIRLARNDDSKLDLYRREFAMVRRRGGSSLFVTIMEPHGGSPLITAVSEISMPGAELALEITAPGRRDLLLVNASDAQGRWQGKPVTASTELAILRAPGAGNVQTGAGGATVVSGSVSWGEASSTNPPARSEAYPDRVALQTEQPAEHPLLAVSRSDASHSLLLDGRLLPPPGSVILVDHGGQRTSAYQVLSAGSEGSGSRLVLTADPGFEYDAETQTSRFVFLPLTTHSGRHVVRFCPVAHLDPGAESR
jgi:hypothetical protein